MRFLTDSSSDPVTGKPVEEDVAPFSAWGPEFSEFLRLYSGRVYASGLYRVHSPKKILQLSELAKEAFPHLRGSFLCFGSDWLGRQFALDASRVQMGQCQVLMLVPGTGEALEIPCTLFSLHDKEFVEDPETSLAISYFQDWIRCGGKHPGLSECVSYKTSLFFGGVDDLENLEICDLEVYWSICAQIIEKVGGLAPGTKIGDISIG